MKRAFVYKDEKSHKFWWIDYSDCSFAVNYGKYGSIGKFGGSLKLPWNPSPSQR